MLRGSTPISMEIALDRLEAEERGREEIELEAREADRLGDRELRHHLRHELHAQADVPGLVALVVRHQLAEDRLDLNLAHALERDEGHRLDGELHADELLQQVLGAERALEDALREELELRRLLAERLEVVVHHVEVPRLVVHLAGGGQLGLERHEPIRELRADLPGRELAPHDDPEDARQRLALLGREVGLAVLGDELGEHVAPVPDLRLSHVVDVLHAARAARFGLRIGLVEHVERNAFAVVSARPQAEELHATALSAPRGGRSCKISVAVTGCSFGSLCWRKSWMWRAARRRPSMREMRAASWRQRSR